MQHDPASLYAFARNLVLAASAGTGKTHALVGIAVHLLLGACQDEDQKERGGLREPIAPRRLAATTFSRKAAAEIQKRLVEELERLAMGDTGAKYRGDLLAACERAGVSRWGEDELASRAQRALDGMARAQIGTLHSFATTIVRAHALRSGLSPEFDLADEERTRERTKEVIERVIEQAADADPRTVRSLVRLAGGVAPLLDQIAHLLDRIAEDGRSAAELEIRTDDAEVLEASLEMLLEHARALVDDKALGAPALALLDARASSDPQLLEGAVVAFCGVAARGKKSEAAEAFYEFRAGLPGATNAERGKNLLRLWSIRDRILPEARAARALVATCEAEIRAASARDAVLGFSDVLWAARDILRDDPSAASETSGALEALLVDEFQDTSRLQRDLVQLVWEKDPKGRTSGKVPHLSRMRERGLLVVGDRKQSIYGFRGADVGVFAEFCVGLAGAPAREALGIAPGRVWEPERPLADFAALRHNRRAVDGLLIFANAFSKERLAVPEPPAELYEVEYVPSTEDLLPPPLREASTATGPRAAWLRVELSDRPVTSRMDEATAIARRVAKIVLAGEPKVRGAAPRWRDVAVLAHRHDMLDAAAYAFAQAKIPYVVAGKGFYAAREVRDVVAMLSFILEPTDVLARIEVLRGPWASVSDETLLALTDPHRGLSDVEGWDHGERRAEIRAEDKEALLALRSVVTMLRRVIDRIGPAEALRKAVRALSLEQTLLILPRGEQRVANVRKLIAIAEREPSARALLARLDRAADGEQSETEAATFSEEEDAVRLLTVHASKGLDFPIVFVPEVGSGARPVERGAMILRIGRVGAASELSTRIVDDDGKVHDPPSFTEAVREARRRERAERSRLAYVAATRASEAMIFVGDRRMPREGATDAYRQTTAAVLADLADRGAARAYFSVEGVDPPVTSPTPAGDSIGPTHAVPALLSAPRSDILTIEVGALTDFAHCPRRFQLARLLGLPEGDASRTVARAALLPSGPYAERIEREGAEVKWQHPFVLSVKDAKGRVVSVPGTIDCVVLWPDAAIDAIAYVAAKPSNAAKYALWIDILAAAARDLEGEVSAVRVGLLPPGGELVWYVTSGDAVREQISTLGERFAEARWRETFPRVPLPTCRAIGCGYVQLCHPREEEEVAAAD